MYTDLVHLTPKMPAADRSVGSGQWQPHVQRDWIIPACMCSDHSQWSVSLNDFLHFNAWIKLALKLATKYRDCLRTCFHSFIFLFFVFPKCFFHFSTSTSIWRLKTPLIIYLCDFINYFEDFSCLFPLCADVGLLLILRCSINLT